MFARDLFFCKIKSYRDYAVNFGRLPFLGLILAVFAITPPGAAWAAFSCRTYYTDCAILKKEAYLVGVRCNAKAAKTCIGNVVGRPGNNCGTEKNKNIYYKDNNYDNKDGRIPIDGSYIYKTTDASKTIPFPKCIDDACGAYEMKYVPKYIKN